MKNKLSDLRNHLFETIEALKDEDKPMDIERARAVSSVAQTILDSAKVELKEIEISGSTVSSEFLEVSEGEADRFLPDVREMRGKKGLRTGKHLGSRVA
jgi:hypothetical protein